MWLMSQVLAWHPSFSTDFIITLLFISCDVSLKWNSIYLDGSQLMQFPVIRWVHGTLKKFLASTTLSHRKGSSMNENNEHDLFLNLVLKFRTIFLNGCWICLSAFCLILFRKFNHSFRNERCFFPVSDHCCNSWQIFFQAITYGSYFMENISEFCFSFRCLKEQLLYPQR